MESHLIGKYSICSLPREMAARSVMVGLLLLLASPIYASAKDIVGTASKIVDGDTLYVCDVTVCEKIRLCGINAPERKDSRGKASTNELKTIAADRELRCTPVGQGTVCDGRSKPTSGDRIVAQCFLGKRDVAGMMVGRGQACDWVKFSGGHYSRNGVGQTCPP
jgi:endonuclease YncB( thermonuclease family)